MSSYDFGTGGYDIEFFVDEADMSTDQAVIIGSTVSYNSDSDSDKSYIYIYKRASNFEFSVYGGSSFATAQLLETYDDDDLEALGTVRIVAHDQFISIYVDKKWIHTFAFEYGYHPLDRYVEMFSSSSTISITNIRKKELSDWREAIFMDMETNSMNAISSVILQRPVDIYPTWDGKLSFSYNPDRSEVTLAKVTRHSISDAGDNKACSDGIVYFTNVAVVVDRDYADEHGFTTRMYRFPDLEQDAVNAAKMQQEMAREKMKKHKIICRIMPQLELGDIANVNLSKSGTGTSVDDDIIVESIQYNLVDGKQLMSISGREDA